MQALEWELEDELNKGTNLCDVSGPLPAQLRSHHPAQHTPIAANYDLVHVRSPVMCNITWSE